MTADLESLIANWRREMLAAGIKTPVPLEELESHLREDIEKQMQSGAGVQAAFDSAVQHLGEPGALRAEFKKPADVMSVGEQKLMQVLCDIGVGLDVLLAVAVLILLNRLPHAPTLREQVLATLPWLLIIAIFGSWRYTHRFLPVITSKRKRLYVSLLSIGLGIACTALLLRLIPESASDPAAFIAAFIWSFVPVVLGFALIINLEETAYRSAVDLQP